MRQLRELAAMVIDKLELRRLEVASRASQARFEHIAATSPDAILCATADGKISVWNAAAEAMFGYASAEVLGQDVAMIVPPALRERLYAAIGPSTADPSAPVVGATTELQGLRADGSIFPTEFSLSTWEEDGARTYGAIIRDISERRRNEDELYRLAHHDHLTSLPNRAVLTRRIEETLAQGDAAAAILLDLDDFKIVNDTLGHIVGDELLQSVAARISACVRTGDTVSRLGGDEFAILLPGVGDPLRATAVAECVVEALGKPFCIQGHDVHIGASAGIALAPTHCQTGDELIANADLALYQAKAEGGGARRLFVPSLRRAALARRQHDIDIRRAIENMELELFYQPQVRLSDGALTGAEALLRWRHPERGVLGPATFIHALESGLLGATVGSWVLETACRQAAKWRRSNGDFRVGVNLFGTQFRTDDLAADVEAMLARTGLAPEALELEITENIILSHDDAIIKPLTRLRAKGVAVAFDDYGTGYASLSLLKRFPITRLKIDQSFVRTMCSSPEDEAVIGAILYLGQRFNVDVIAEGIETEPQADALIALGCTEGQGYLFGKPMSAPDFTARFIAPKAALTGTR
jgi:diguanylate cyclase (GGDEF)-like protein/PAS domain S-box-containing protein